jgi:peptide/nickel transport system permease protein
MTQIDLSTASQQEPPGKESKSSLKGTLSGWFESLGIFSFILQRLLFAIVVLLAIIFLSYFGLNMARGMDFGAAVVDAVSDSWSYITRLLQGDLGTTTAGAISMLEIPVGQVIVERLPRSLALLGISLLLASVVGLFLGIRAAARGARHSLGILIATIIGISIPSFFAAFLLQWLVITITKESGRSFIPVGGFGWDTHLILPVLVLAARPLAQITRITFVTVRDVLNEDYVRTARSKGLRKFQIMSEHVLRNAAIPILTTIGISLRFALSSLPVVEAFFGWNGVGYTLLGAIAMRDDDLVVALLLCFGVLFILINFILDLSYRLIDPRVGQTPAYLATGKRQKPLESIKSTLADVGDYITDNALTAWFKQRSRSEDDKDVIRLQGQTTKRVEAIETTYRQSNKPSIWVSVWRNFPFVVGGVMVLVLLAVVLFGPGMTPHSPYATKGLEMVDGQLVVPPFAPGGEFPWGTDMLGRDLMSLIFSGAQLTLFLALLVVAARMVVGIIIGAIAGWTNGSWLDRLILGSADVIAAFPALALLLAMILVLALGIRQGVWPFVIALGFVGWGEIMLFVRGEVISIRPRAFIESAVAIGARTPRIIYRHVMPNLLSPLISIAAIEMGAVLMLLGELGFLSIFIGGGAFYQLETFSAPYHYSDVPEWGALLSNIRTYARSYPWLAFVPVMAFFVAILSFNLFGEGVRRLVDDGSLVINRLVNRYTIAFIGLAGVVLFVYRANSGPVAYYEQHASVFSGQQAMAHVSELTDPEFEGRALGTDGLDDAADYIAGQFRELGLQPAGQDMTYLQERKRSFERLEENPQMAIDDGGPALVQGEDFNIFPFLFLSDGEITGPVRAVTLGEPRPVRGFGAGWRYPDIRQSDFSDEILLVTSWRAADELDYLPRGGLLVVADDPELLGRKFTLPGRSGELTNPMSGRTTGEETPSFWISEEVANRILESSGKTVEDLLQDAENLEIGGVGQLTLDTQVSMSAKGYLEEYWPVYNVIGHMPGLESTPGETQLDNKVIMVLAQYDSPPPAPDEEYHPGANDNASAVAVMLEAIRVMQETEFQPKRTFLFVAYSGEGLEGGEDVSDPDVNRILQAKHGFITYLEPEAIVHLRGLGGGSGDQLEISAGGSLRLAELFEDAGKRVGAEVSRSEEPIDISIIYLEGSPTDSGQVAPEVRLSWDGYPRPGAGLLSNSPVTVTEEVTVTSFLTVISWVTVISWATVTSFLTVISWVTVILWVTVISWVTVILPMTVTSFEASTSSTTVT